MESFFRFAYLPLLYAGVALICVAVWYRYKYYKFPVYLYPVTQMLSKKSFYTFSYKKILFLMRLLTLVGLAALASRPQLVDQHSKVIIQGIDIMMVLDVSGSMQLFDDLAQRKPRIVVAKQEAINFIKKRINDPIGLVLFGQEAVTRVPLTLDKTILETIISETNLGDIDPQGTMLSKGLLMAINRLKNSTAKSRVIIMLTDGEPTPGDENPDIVIDLAKRYGIKIYTIGIGGPEGGFCEMPFGIQAFNIPFNTALLSHLADATGGKAFHATKPEELARIYDIINQLEKTEYESNVFNKYEDLLMPFLWIIIGLVCSEIILSQTVWFGL